MKPRIVFIHGNETEHWSGGWAGWFKGELDKLGYPTFFETMPDSILARAKYWLPFLSDHIQAGPSDVLVGWSSGAVAAMRYAESHQILGSVLIGANYHDLGDPAEKQSGYFDLPWDWESIKKHQSHLALFYSDDDPYIAEQDFKTLGSNLHAKIFKLSGRQHFMSDYQFPELLAYIQETYP